jgi:hypothetical protein
MFIGQLLMTRISKTMFIGQLLMTRISKTMFIGLSFTNRIERVAERSILCQKGLQQVMCPHSFHMYSAKVSGDRLKPQRAV